MKINGTNTKIIFKISKKLFKNKIILKEENLKLLKYPTHVKLNVLPSAEISNIKEKSFLFGKILILIFNF